MPEHIDEGHTIAGETVQLEVARQPDPFPSARIVEEIVDPAGRTVRMEVEATGPRATEDAMTLWQMVQAS